MVLIEQSGEVHINELARDKLKEAWKGAYKGNIKNSSPTLPKNYMEAIFQSMALK
jgi:hypothetical protein